MSSIFVQDSLEREHDEYGKWKFREPKPKQIMLLPQCFNISKAELKKLRKKKKKDPEAEVDFSTEDLNLDKVYDLLLGMIQDWPADRDITKDNLEDVNMACLGWLLQTSFEIINEQGQVSEAEVKNSNK